MGRRAQKTYIINGGILSPETELFIDQLRMLLDRENLRKQAKKAGYEDK
jgi:hypothetical protein